MADNIELYRNLHNAHDNYGRTANRLMDYILPFARDARPAKVLDYGCGKSKLCEDVAAALGATPLRYDPAIPEIAQKPEGQVDLVLNNDVLEHVPEVHLDAIIAEIRSYSPKAIFTISNVLALAILENGENAHCTVHPAEWWAERLKKHFDYVLEVPTFRDTACSFITWRPSDETLAHSRKALKQRKRRQRLERRINRLKNAVQLFVAPPLSMQALLAQLDGKSVAVVGNALSLRGKDFGAEIDGHDIVVRFNGAPIPHTRSHGARTDWVATGIPFPPGIVRGRHVKTVLWLTPNRKNLAYWMVRRKAADFYLHPKAENKRLADAIGVSRPSSGAMMVDLLMANPKLKRVSLYGFDFFATHSFSGNHTSETTPHEFGKERAFIQALAARDPRLSLSALDLR